MSGEPRTEAGRALMNEWQVDELDLVSLVVQMRDRVLAVEAEAAADARSEDGRNHRHDDGREHDGSLRACYKAEADGLRVALEDMTRQFAHWSDKAGGYWTGGLSSLELAFETLGWDDPHPAPEVRCDEPGCLRQAACGWPTRPGGTGPNGGYRRTCGGHMVAEALGRSGEPGQ